MIKIKNVIGLRQERYFIKKTKVKDFPYIQN